jgi:hypothetical protein
VTSDDTQIDEFLKTIKSHGRSSPAGRHWDDFHKLLCQLAAQGKTARPPMPLILAASGESDGAKHRRLGEQLKWAKANGILAAALRSCRSLTQAIGITGLQKIGISRRISNRSM